jgi:hypothetical protein
MFCKSSNGVSGTNPLPLTYSFVASIYANDSGLARCCSLSCRHFLVHTAALGNAPGSTALDTTHDWWWSVHGSASTSFFYHLLREGDHVPSGPAG